jgi:CRP-like cAMP-binding protein
MEIQAKLTVLERSAFFQGLGADVLEQAARTATDQVVKKDESLFQQGDAAEQHYLVAWGRLRLDQTTPDGKNVVLRFMGPGDLVGSVAVFRNAPYPATPTAVEDTRVLAWSAERMMELLREHPALAAKAMGMMGGRIAELQERLQQISTQQVERRIAAAILRIVAQSGRKTEGGVEIPFALSRQDLAEMTGTTLHTVSRTLSAWMNDGILEGKRSSHLVILQPHRLVEIAEQA